MATTSISTITLGVVIAASNLFVLLAVVFVIWVLWDRKKCCFAQTPLPIAPKHNDKRTEVHLAGFDSTWEETDDASSPESSDKSSSNYGANKAKRAASVILGSPDTLKRARDKKSQIPRNEPIAEEGEYSLASCFETSKTASSRTFDNQQSETNFTLQAGNSNNGLPNFQNASRGEITLEPIVMNSNDTLPETDRTDKEIEASSAYSVPPNNKLVEDASDEENTQRTSYAELEPWEATSVDIKYGGRAMTRDDTDEESQGNYFLLEQKQEKGTESENSDLDFDQAVSNEHTGHTYYVLDPNSGEVKTKDFLKQDLSVSANEEYSSLQRT